MKHQANVKLLFTNGVVRDIQFGDFGPIETDGAKRIQEKRDWEDCILAWPVNPASTGAFGILRILRLNATKQCADRIRELNL